ncbi:MAG: amino acid permease [Gemmatimonadota bacterium]
MSEALPTDGPPALVRAIGVRGLTLNCLNLMVGASIFVVPALVAQGLGAAAIVSYILCAIAMGLVALCFAEAGSRVSETGGAYAYVSTAFGPFAGYLVGTLLWISNGVLANASIAAVFAGTVGTLVPSLSSWFARTGVLLVVYTILAITNIRGVRTGTRFVEAVTVLKMFPLFLVIVAALVAAPRSNLTWTGMPSPAHLGESALLVIFAFSGFEGALTASGEVRNPGRTVPRAIIAASIFVAFLYCAIQLSAQGILGAELTKYPDAPLAEAVRRVFGPASFVLLLAAAAFSNFGFMGGDILATPRALYAFANQGYLPRMLGAVHPRFRTPYVSIAVYCTLSALMAISGTYRQLALLSVVGTLVIYLSTCLAVLQLRRKGIAGDGPPFRLPGGPTIPLLACGVIVILFSTAHAAEFEALAGILVVAAILFMVSSRAKPVRAGPA